MFVIDKLRDWGVCVLMKFVSFYVFFGVKKVLSFFLFLRFCDFSYFDGWLLSRLNFIKFWWYVLIVLFIVMKLWYLLKGGIDLILVWGFKLESLDSCLWWSLEWNFILLNFRYFFVSFCFELEKLSLIMNMIK